MVDSSSGMGTKLAVLVAALVIASVVAARRQAAPPPAKCTPVPISPMDPQPGLAPFRCLPATKGDPTIEADPARRVHGNGDRPSAKPPLRARPVIDLQALGDRKAYAYLDFLDAVDSGDQQAAERAREEYERASARLEEARRAAQ